jgi:tetratricopeptide (TPR) repeat protein
MKNNSLLQLSNNSTLITIGASTVTGYTPNSNTFSGDRIDVANDSRLDLNSNTSISSTSDFLWEGIHFSNCNTQTPSIIRGNISGIQQIKINNSNVLINDATFTECGGIQIIDSDEIEFINVDYHDNLMGIIVNRSKIIADNLNIYDNSFGSSLASGIEFYWSPIKSFIKNSNISSNRGDGVYVHESKLWLQDVNILSNGQNGLKALENGGIEIDKESTIANNGINYYSTNVKYAEVYGFPHSFPRFIYTTSPPHYAFPVSPVNKIGGNDFTDNYLLYSVGPPPLEKIHIEADIDRNNPERFYPDINCFSFYNAHPDIENILYNSGLECADNGEYYEAILFMMEIINDYPDSEYALMALNVLPYYIANLDEMYHDQIGFEELIDYLEQIEEEILYIQAQKAIAAAMIMKGNYIEPINIYDQIMCISEDYIESLLAELNQAYCYYRLYESGTRATNELAKRKPKSLQEYLNIALEINNLIDMVEENKEELVIPVKDKLISQNYPNPFNPETTISFNIATKGNVSINIYNIKGQKIKTLLSEDFESGNHNVVWNGTDDNGKPVGSGIYLYRVKSNNETITNKMLLLK